MLTVTKEKVQKPSLLVHLVFERSFTVSCSQTIINPYKWLVNWGYVKVHYDFLLQTKCIQSLNVV